MNILFVSSASMIAPDLAYRLKQEGHQVKLFFPNPELRLNFEGLVEKTGDWRQELPWVGKTGLIVFDDVGSGKVQDELRAEGYSVFGGCELGDKLEADRSHAQTVMAEHGIKTVEIKNFKDIPSAIKYVKENNGSWVIKQNGHSSKSLNYVSMFDDGRDIINVLENYARIPKYQLRSITLQRRIQGVEIGVGRYFNGHDWVGPIEINIEHKKLFPGDLGPPTSEMGTLGWYDDDEHNRLFQETLAKLKPYLQKINYRGDIDLNCIVNEEGAFPLEVTPRMGTPIVHLHDELHRSPWGEFLKAVADGRPYNLKWQRGYGIVVMLTVPPFPYSKKLKQFSSFGVNIYFDKKMTPADLRHLHFEEAAKRRDNGSQPPFYISGFLGYVMYVTAVAESVESARHKVYQLIHKIQIPKMFYRNDIGSSFVRENRHKLEELGYATGPTPKIKAIASLLKRRLTRKV